AAPSDEPRIHSVRARRSTPALCRILNGHDVTSRYALWRFASEEPDPYQLEWEDLTTAIRENKPYNEVRRGAEASLITAMETGFFSTKLSLADRFDIRLRLSQVLLEIRSAAQWPKPTITGQHQWMGMKTAGLLARYQIHGFRSLERSFTLWHTRTLP